MNTIELDDETTALLNRLVKQEHIATAQVIKNALNEHAQARTPKTRLISNFAGVLANSPSFQDEPFEIQKMIRNEWN